MSPACLQYFCPGNKDLSVQRLLDSWRNKTLSWKKRARLAPIFPPPLLCEETMPPKGAGSWPLAGGRNSTTAHPEGENPNYQLPGTGQLFCPLPLDREETTTFSSQDGPLEATAVLSPQRLPSCSCGYKTDGAGEREEAGDTQLLIMSPQLLVHWECVHSPFADVLEVTWIRQKGTGRTRRTGRKTEGQGLHKRRAMRWILPREVCRGAEVKADMGWL